MTIRSREESIEALSERLKPEQLRKVITQGYSDISLSVMADFSKQYEFDISDSGFSPQTINKLSEAYMKNVISADDLYRITDYSHHTTANEPYINDFLKSIDAGFHHETAAKIFAAVNFEDCTYTEAVDYVKSGAFYPTNYASLSVTNKVAEELHDINVPLRACEGFNYCYDISNLNEAFDNNAAFFVQDKDMAVVVHDLMKNQDWEKFKERADLSEFTADALQNSYQHFQKSKVVDTLKEKISSEHSAFLNDMLERSPEVIIKSAYEIVTKDEISMYLRLNEPPLSIEQCNSLLSSSNSLDEIYNEWVNNEMCRVIDDVALAMQSAADKIHISIDREKQKGMAEPIPEQKQAVKPKNKLR